MQTVELQLCFKVSNTDISVRLHDPIGSAPDPLAFSELLQSTSYTVSKAVLKSCLRFKYSRMVGHRGFYVFRLTKCKHVTPHCFDGALLYKK